MDEPIEVIGKKAKRLTFGLLAAIVFYLLIVIIFWRITDEIVLEKGTAFDLRISAFLADYISPATTKVMLFFTMFGGSEFLLPTYIIICLYLLFKRRWWDCFIIVAVGLIGKLLLGTAKNIFQRTRPMDPLVVKELGYSYPSGHSFSVFTFFGLMAFLVWDSKIPVVWKWIASVVFFIVACGTAISRVYLHVHFASDVIAGFCLSMIWLTISIWIIQKIRTSGILKRL